MKSNLAVFLIVFFISGIFSACNDNEPESTTVTKEQHLTDKSWELSAVETVPVIEGINPMDYLEDCYKDNMYAFLSGGILNVDEGPIKCNEDSQQVLVGEWALTQNEQQLELQYDNITQNFTILELTAEVLRVQTTIDYQGFSFLANLTFIPVNP